jgi:hypothetical protein
MACGCDTGDALAGVTDVGAALCAKEWRLKIRQNAGSKNFEELIVTFEDNENIIRNQANRYCHCKAKTTWIATGWSRSGWFMKSKRAGVFLYAAFSPIERTLKRFIWIESVRSILRRSPRSAGPAKVDAAPRAEARAGCEKISK